MDKHCRKDAKTKHGPDARVDQELLDAVLAKAENKTLTCAAAHALARELGKSPAEIGMAADFAEARLVKCQLGLFGYGDPEKRVKPAESVDAGLESALCAAAGEGRISCLSVWEAAAACKTGRREAAAACEKLGLRVKPCQLDAF